MGKFRWKQTLAAAALSVGAVTMPLQSVQAGEIKIGLITPLSGPIASQGIPFSKGMAAGQHAMPEAGGHTISYILLDDASDPSQSARNARKLIEEEKIDVLVGTGGVPGAMALAAIARESEVPLVSFTPLAPTENMTDWAVTVVQSAPLMLNAAVDHMKTMGVKTVGYIGFSDSWGDLAYRSLQRAAEKAGIEVVTNERYARSDTSVTGQALKIVAANPDAVIGGTAGTPGALPYLALADRGYQGLIYGTHGIINPEFVRIAGASAEGLYTPSGPAVVSDQLPEGYPTKAAADRFAKAYEETHGEKPRDAFSAHSFDVWTVIADAASRVPAGIEPGTPEYRTALRDAIYETKDLAGNHGVFTFAKGALYGVDERAAVIIKLEGGKWVLQP